MSCVAAAPPDRPALIAHRGMLRDAPENTITAFAACIHLGLGFELDVRRTKDGTLIVLHDETVDRTTDGKGKVAEMTLDQVKMLDAGRRFDPTLAGQRVPTLDEVFALLHERKSSVPVAIDLKISDPSYEADIVALANKHNVLPHLVFIGRTIDEPAVRKKLREADRRAHVCVLAQTAKDLAAAVSDADADWVYTRFVPTAEEAETVRRAGKKLFLSGPPVNQYHAENFRQALAIRADAMLTDFPLECRRLWREGKGGE
jgi:glycerophosphoryl diester phosphodiesterase